jgi:hypothetical protein
MYIDDGDNNSNNHDDDDEYNNPETHDHGHHSAGHGRRPSVALPSCMIIVAAILSPGKNIF